MTYKMLLCIVAKIFLLHILKLQLGFFYAKNYTEVPVKIFLTISAFQDEKYFNLFLVDFSC